MRRWLWFLLMGFSFVIAAQSYVYALDSPHNLSSDVDCGECHGESLFQADPSGMTTEELNEAYNAMCLRCHNKTSGTYHALEAPDVDAHASSVINGSYTFTTGCIDCHHPHYQSQQLFWGRRNAGSPGQLFTGMATGIAYYNSGNNPRGAWDSTIVTYDPASLVVKAGSVWDTTDGLYPDGETTGEPIDIEAGLKTLEAKGFNPGNSPGRGAMFLPYKDSHYNSRMIEAIDTDANTITFKGIVPSNDETYMTTYGFAIYLGMKINTVIGYPTADPARPVYLFDRTGPNAYAHTDKLGASGEDSTPNGICQACHENTNYWRKTPSAARDDGHYSGDDCMECHAHILGFKPVTSVDHTGTTINLSRSPLECTGCHDPSLDAEYVYTIHDNDCNNCHTASIPSLRSDYGVSIGPGNDCAGCHENSPYTYATDFANQTNAHQVQDHSGITGTTSATPTSNCSGCHDSSPRADIVTVTHNNNCQNCHNNSTTDGRLHDGTIAASAGGTTSYGTATGHTILSTVSNCDACHSSIATDFENHIYGTATDHAPGGSGSTMILDTTPVTGDLSQEAGTLCSDCHSDYDTQQATSDNLLTWRSIIYEHDLDGTKDGLGACVTCHNATRDVCANPAVCTQDGPTIQQVIANATFTTGNQANCQDCHEDKIDALSSDAVHGNHDTNAFGWDSNCVDCHATTNNYVVQEVHFGTCDNCHAGGTYTAATNKVGDATFGVDGDATIAEGAANADPKFDPAIYNCTYCHDLNDADVNAASIGGIHHDNKNSNTDCTTACHTVSGYEGDHTNRVADSGSDCISCHTGVVGGLSGAPIDGGDGAKHDACTTCHEFAAAPAMNSVLVAAPGGSKGVTTMNDATPLVTNDGGGNCVQCHTTGWESMHVSAPGINHDAPNNYVTTSGSTCNTSGCHDSGGTGDARASSASPFIAVGDVHETSSCSTCHEANGTRKTAGLTKADQNPAGGGNCETCHANTSTWTTIHDSSATVDHAAEVANLATCTDSCHTTTGNFGAGQIGSLISGADDKVHDTCATCHAVNGAVTGITANGGSDTIDVIAPNGGTCAACHDTWTFDDHSHHSIANQVSFDSAIDRSQELNDPSTACDQCHTPSGTLSTWTGVYNEHSAACATCHNFTVDATGDPGTPVVATVNTVIGTDATANCTTCHDKKLWSNASSTHGGHTPTQFGWTAATQTSCGAVGCHDYVTNDDVVAEVHNGDCTNCHAGSPYGAGNEDIGSTTYGVDGDATLADGAAAAGTPFDPTVYTCTLCHDVSDPDVNAASIGGIHHLNKNSNTDCTTACHTVSGHEGDHTNRVADSGSDCISCHTGVVGSSAGAPIDGADGAKHDACTTCHEFAAAPAMNSVLVAAPGGSKGVTTMNDATPLVTDDGGGNCVQCHTTGWNSMHVSAPGVIHDSPNNFVTTTGSSCNTASCHDAGGTGSARASSASPFIAVGDVHETSACLTCHESNGTRKTAGLTKADQNPAGGGNCETCHANTSTWTTIHDSSATVDHAAEVANLATCTDSCHTATGNFGAGQIGSLISGADNKVHDACATCHTASGTVATVTAQGGSDTIDVIAANGGTCAACHDTWTFDDHSHHSIANQVSFDSATDRSQELNDPSTACDQCHTPSGTLSTWTGVYNEHSAACATCHNFTVDATGVPGTPVVATVNTVIGTDATANCTTCHDKKLWSNATSTHGGHSSSDFAWTPAMETSCGTVTCHDSATNTNVVGQVHDGRSAAFQGSNCQNCHDNSGGGDGTTIVGEATYGSDGDATVASPTTHTEECIVCHDSTNYHGGAIHHDLADAEAGNCETCHIADVGETTTPQTRALTNLDMPTNLPCNFCHLYFPGNAYQTDANGRVKIFNMDWDPNDTASRWETPVEMPTHAVSKSTNPPIADYSACFACHGATSYTGTNGTAPQVRPFHGYGPPYTGDDGLTGGRGAAFADADHHNVFHDIPPHEGCDPGTSTTSSVHPGPFNFNALGTSTGWDRKQDYNCTETTKVYADSVSNGGGCGGQPRWHDMDPGDFQRKDAVYEAQGEFQVPWDGFADGVLAPGSGSINMDFGSFWGTYHGRSGAVNPTIPLAPLTIP